jgi:hypothetical protein
MSAIASIATELATRQDVEKGHEQTSAELLLLIYELNMKDG